MSDWGKMAMIYHLKFIYFKDLNCGRHRTEQPTFNHSYRDFHVVICRGFIWAFTATVILTTRSGNYIIIFVVHR